MQRYRRARERSVNVLVEQGATDPCVCSRGCRAAARRSPASCSTGFPTSARWMSRWIPTSSCGRHADGWTVARRWLHPGRDRALRRRSAALDPGCGRRAHPARGRSGARCSALGGSRRRRVARGDGRRGEIPVEPPARRDFTLVIKHPVAFTALLPILLRAVPGVRDRAQPARCARLLGERSVPSSRGTAGSARDRRPGDRCSPGGTDDRLERQLTLLDWFFECMLERCPASG